MKNTTKIAIGIGAAILAYSVSKTTQLKNAIQQLTGKIADIRKVKINMQDVSLSTVIDLQLNNPTNTLISLNSAGAIKIKRISIFNKATNALIGQGSTEISKINILPNSSIIIKDIKIYVPIITGILNNLDIFSNPDLLNTELTIEAFGKEYTLTL